MMESIFLTVNYWMTGAPHLAVAGSFIWGMISVLFSPCHLASIPLMIGYVAGQQVTPSTRQAGFYAFLFAGGLFFSIAAVGIACSILGRMLGDVGPYWQILVGAILIWVALGMFGVQACSMNGGGLLQRFNLRGFGGAFLLGLSYGLLSGSCTFGFIAPILAVITVQEEIAIGILLITLFAVGHSLPIFAAGTSAAMVSRLLESHRWQTTGNLFRKGASLIIVMLGLYFISNPLWEVFFKGV